jgi:hypothetical protein
VLSGCDARNLEAVPVFMTQLVKDRSLQASTPRMHTSIKAKAETGALSVPQQPWLCAKGDAKSSSDVGQGLIC